MSLCNRATGLALLLASVLACAARAGQDDVANTSPPVFQGKINGVALDSAGNRYLVGGFAGTVDFNPGIGADSCTAAGVQDAFITRINADGSYGWTLTFGGSGDDNAAGVVVAGTTVYVAGTFFGNNAGFNGLGTFVSSGLTDTFILALDSATGARIAAFNGTGVQTFGGSNNEFATSIAISGNSLFVAGFFSSTNSGVGGTGTVASAGLNDAFVISLNATTGAANLPFNGKAAQTFGGANNDDFANAVTVIGTTVYVAGSFLSTGAGIGGFGSISAQSSSRDAFVIALDSTTGAAKTAFRGNGILVFGGALSDEFLAVAGNATTLYVGGYFLSATVGIAAGPAPIAANSGPAATSDGVILALDPVAGINKTTFHTTGVQIIGGGGNETVEALVLSPTALYATGSFASANAGIGGLGTLATAGGRDTFVVGLDPASGAALPAFNGTGAQTFGGTGDELATWIALGASTVYAAGSFTSGDARAGSVGPFNAAGFGGYVLQLDAAGQIIQNSAPVITAFSTPDNPALVNTVVTYTLSGTDADTPLLYYTIDFADSTAPATGTFPSGGSVSVTHTYAIGGNFTVTATVDDRFKSAFAQFAQTVPSPNSGAVNVKNVSDGAPPVVNPVDGLEISFMGSNGGVIQLGLNQNLPAAVRAAFAYNTHWDDIPGKSTDGPGVRPVHSYSQHGIFVALCTASDPATGTLVGRGRRTIAIGTKETGEVLPSVRQDGTIVRALGDPPSSAITTRGIRGRFIFQGDANDTVSYVGTIMLPPGLDTSQPHEFSMGIGNIIVTTTVDARGRGQVPGSPAVLKRLKLGYKVRRNQITKGGETARVEIRMSLAGMVAAGFDTEGITNRATDVAPGQPAARQIQIAILLEGVPYQGLIPVQFAVSRSADFGTISGRRF